MNVNRLLRFMLFIGVFTLLVTFNALAQETDGGFVYQVNGEYAEITGYTGDMTDIVIPGTLEDKPVRIGEGAFRGNAALTSVTAGSGVTAVGPGAFADCTVLSDITLADTVLTLGRDAFANTAFYNDGDNWEDGILYTGRHLVAANDDLPADEWGYPDDITVRDGTLVIGEAAFENKALGVINLPVSLKAVNDGAFSGCTDVGSAMLIYYYNTEAGIPEKDFGSIIDWHKIDFGTDNGSVTEGVVFFRQKENVGDYTMFYEMEGWNDHQLCLYGADGDLSDFVIPATVDGETLKHITDSAFAGDERIKRLEIHVPVFIGIESFMGCPNLTSVDIYGTDMTTIWSGAFADCANLKRVTFHGLADIENECFKNCVSLDTVTLPSADGSRYSVGMGAFDNCAALESINIPRGCSLDANGCFHGCTALKNIYAEEGEGSLYKSVDGVLFSYNMQNLGQYPMGRTDAQYTVPEGVYYLGLSFNDCAHLKRINLPLTLRYAPGGAFLGCTALESVEVPEENEYLASRDGVLFDKAMSRLIVYPAEKSRTEYEVPKSVRQIEYAFNGASKLESVILPEGLEEIGYRAFENCAGLKSVTLPQSLRSIKSSAFCGCASLNDVVLPEGLNYLEPLAFKGCSSLENIVLPEGLSCLYNETFADCASLKTVVLPEGLYQMQEKAFKGCSSLESVVLPNTLYMLGREAFADCVSLKSVVLPESLDGIDEMAFAGCSGMKYIVALNIIFPLMENGTFGGCDGVTDIYYVGDEDTWLWRTADYTDPPFLNARVHYYSTGPAELAEPEITVDGENLVIRTRVLNLDPYEPMVIMLATDNGVYGYVVGSEAEFTVPADGVGEIRLFVWESLETMRPLCEAYGKEV